jgi:membrane protease YdiL (CAAX protease family)
LLKQIFIFLVALIMLSAALTPIVCEALIFQQGELNFPFSRVFDRVAMVVAIFLLFVMRNTFDLRLLASGVFSRKELIADFVIGLALTASVGIGLTLYYISTEVLVWSDNTTDYLIRKFIFLLPTALVIALLEEIFFRRIVQSLFERISSYILAVVFTSMIYAFIHFITPLKDFGYQSFEPFAGFIYIEAVLIRIFNLELLPGVLGLFIIGLILADTYRRRETLTLAIGLHAGWIIALKFYTYCAKVSPGYEISAVLGRRYFLLGKPLGWLSFIFVWLVTIFLIEKVLNKKRERLTSSS